MDSNYSLNAYFCESLLIRGAPFDVQWGHGRWGRVFFFCPFGDKVLFCFCFFTPQMDRFGFFQSHWWVKILCKNFHFATGFWGQVGLLLFFFFFFFFCCFWQQIIFFFFKKIPCPPPISTGTPLMFMFSNT